MLHGEPEYRRRAREKAAKDEQETRRERDKAAEDASQQKIIVALNGLNEKIDRRENKPHPHTKREWPWKLTEVLGLWLAACVGVGAIWFGNHDAGLQRDVMQSQLEEMQAEKRPWVGVTGFTIQGDPIPNTGLFYAVQIQNSGRSPAFDVSILAVNPHQSSDTVRIPHSKCADDCTQSNLELLPGQVQGMRVPFRGKPLLKIGEIGWLIVRIDYSDAAGDKHKTGVCFTVSTEIGPQENGRATLTVTELGCQIPDSNYAD